MPDVSSAPDLSNDSPPTDARDDATAAAVLSDRANMPGGGGLGGADAAASGSAVAGGSSPNSPIDTGLDTGAGDGEAEAKTRALAEVAREPRPLSR